jgi:O-antigen/teichoic acid export membrane protein
MTARESNVIWGIMSMWGSTLLTLMLGFVSVSVSARMLSEDHFGVYFLLLTLVYLLQVSSSLGLRSSAARFIASAATEDERQQVVNSTLTFSLLVLAGMSLVALVARPVFLVFFSSDLLATFYGYVPLLFCAQTADLVLDSVMQGYHLYRQMALARLVTSVVNVALVVGLVWRLDWGLEGLILATLVSLVAAVLLRVVALPVKVRPCWDVALLRRLVRFGLPLQGNDVLTFISQRLDVLILGAMVSPASVAYLSVAAKIPQNFQRLFESLYAVYYPHMAGLYGHEQRAKADVVLNRFLRITAFGTAGAALFFVLFQREIVVLIFSEKYLPSAPALGILMLIFTLSVASTIMDNTLIAAGHPDYLPVISLADTVPSVLSNLALIPPFGFMGAVVAKLIANITTNPVSVWALRREKIGLRISEYLKPIGVMLLCLAVYFALGWPVFVLKAGLLLAFVVLCVAFSVITNRDVMTFVGNFRLSRRQPV